jgi:hypothetical protein
MIHAAQRKCASGAAQTARAPATSSGIVAPCSSSSTARAARRVAAASHSRVHAPIAAPRAADRAADGAAALGGRHAARPSSSARSLVKAAAIGLNGNDVLEPPLIKVSSIPPKCQMPSAAISDRDAPRCAPPPPPHRAAHALLTTRTPSPS